MAFRWRRVRREGGQLWAILKRDDAERDEHLGDVWNDELAERAVVGQPVGERAVAVDERGVLVVD